MIWASLVVEDAVGRKRWRRALGLVSVLCLLAVAQPAVAEWPAGVSIVATTSVPPPSPGVWEKHPAAYPGIGIAPAYLLPQTNPQEVTMAGSRSSFRHYFCLHKQVEEITPSRDPACSLVADRTALATVTLTTAMIAHGGVTWHIAVARRPSLRAQWLPIPAIRAVIPRALTASGGRQFGADLHPKVNGLRVTSSGPGAVTVRLNEGVAKTIAAGETHAISALATGANTLTFTSDAPGGGTITRTLTLRRSLLPDAALKAAVARALGKRADADLAADELLTLRELILSASGVADLAGLDKAANLERLALDGNGLREIGDLAGLGRLSWLDLSGNAITDISPLAGLAGVRTLLLDGNAVTDLAPLDALTGLRALSLSGNAVAELAPLAALTELEELWLDDNAITRVGPLAPLRGLRYLHLGRNRIANVAPLAGLTGLTRLALNDNAIADVRPLSRLRALVRLNLERNAVRDVAPLARLPMLERLRLGGNRIADIAPLLGSRGLGAGDAVGLGGNPLTAAAIGDQVPALRSSGAAVLYGWPVHVFPAAADASGRQGFVRVINRSTTAGEVLVEAVDDAGVRAAPVWLRIGPGQARHFNSRDLEQGNAAKGLPDGVGAPTEGGWRLTLASPLDIEVLAYIRTPDGFLTSVHDVLARDEAAGALRAPTFNPGRNREQASSLRFVNPGATAAPVNVWGVDDHGRGRLATGLSVPAGAAFAVAAPALEAYRIGDSGRGLGRGVGKWRLDASVRWPVAGASLLTSRAGHLTNLSSPGSARGADGTWRLPLFPSALDRQRQGFARVVNRSACAGMVWITAFDDAGARLGTVALMLDALATAHFNSDDLESGAPGKGLAAGVGLPTRGDWRLELRSDLDLRAYAYIRATDGFLTAMHDVAPSQDGAARVPFFNPASNRRQRSLLRLVNNGAEDARATIAGVDDAGVRGSPVGVTVPAGQALTFSAADLEAGAAGLDGALGDGHGKWRLTVAAQPPLVVMSLLASPSGHLTNLSTATRHP